jgi:hypothetical protein
LVFRNEVLEPFARVLSGPRAEMRAAMALAVLMGTTIVRTIMKAEKAYECESNTFRDRLLAMLRVALATDPDAMPDPSTG